MKKKNKIKKRHGNYYDVFDIKNMCYILYYIYILDITHI